MRRGKYLLLLLQLAEHVLLCECENQKVEIFPNFNKIYLGDLFFLKCPFQDGVMWYHDNNVQKWKDKSLKIPVAAHNHSGSYRCGANGVYSDNISVNVLDFYPRASLILKTGQPVMPTRSSVTLRLDNDEGLVGWSCFALRSSGIHWIMLNVGKGNKSIEFQPNKQMDPETIFWCANKDRSQRSNQVVLRTSDKAVLMEMYFAPVTVGDPLTFRCLHWDMENISKVLWYRNGKNFVNSSSLTHKINSVAKADEADYRCEAVITNKDLQASDVQQLSVKEKVMRAVVSGTMGLSCSCPGCSNVIRSMWYKINGDSPPSQLPGSHRFMIPGEEGTYACIAVHDLGRTIMSEGYAYNPVVRTSVITLSLVFIILAGLAAACAVFRKQNRRSSNTGPWYEDVMLKSKEDDKYERLQGHRAQKESEYDALQPAETEQMKKEGDYQPLAKAALTEGVYHTLGMEGEGSGGAAGGYEALQKKTMQDEIYHTIGMEGAASGGQN